MNLSGSIDLLKLKNAGIATINGKSGAKKCVVIPIEENDLYVSMDENLKAKSVYLGFNVWERKEVSQYGKTHSIKQNFSKDFREQLTKEELDAKPFIGEMKPIEKVNAVEQVAAPVEEVEEKDDLPF